MRIATKKEIGEVLSEAINSLQSVELPGLTGITCGPTNEGHRIRLWNDQGKKIIITVSMPRI